MQTKLLVTIWSYYMELLYTTFKCTNTSRRKTLGNQKLKCYTSPFESCFICIEKPECHISSTLNQALVPHFPIRMLEFPNEFKNVLNVRAENFYECVANFFSSFLCSLGSSSIQIRAFFMHTVLNLNILTYITIFVIVLQVGT